MPRDLRGALMVGGATSNAGKTTVVTGLCRALARAGVRVAPFKAQNMSLNSVVTQAGDEIGRAQGVQALAAGIEPEAAMNPILLKPTGERTSQVIVCGQPRVVMSATEYHEHKPALLPVVLEALTDLRARFDVVLCEGAGSPAEINLADRDIANLRVAGEFDMPAIVVGDIDLGGVFAALYGTVALLPDEHRRLVRGFVINKLRGDPALLLDGCAQLQTRTGVRTLGVLPWVEDVGIDAEDSLALRDPVTSGRPALGDELDVAVVQFPRLSNFTDFDPLACEPGVRVRLVADGAALGRPDLVVLGGTKATVADLAWLRERGLDDALRRSDAIVLGICGGYQMLGRVIEDPVESGAGRVEGLALLPVTTTFGRSKVIEQRAGTSLGHEVTGYRIHHGRVRPEGGATFVELTGRTDGEGPPTLVDGVRDGRVFGTTLHGLFEADAFRRAFLESVAAHGGKRFVAADVSFAAIRESRFERLADLLEAHLDLEALLAVVAEGAPASKSGTRP